LTERVRRRLVRHVRAEQPGELLSLDTFYVGRWKGVGTVWQITACDAACSYGWARVQAGDVKGAAVLAFLREVVLPIYTRAGWTLRRVLTDRGKEFKDAFDAGLARLGIRHTRTQPRHAWTNGFVERFQGTILHEHWRLVFRRTYFRSVRQLQRTLDAFLAFYNQRRPHQGYRLLRAHAGAAVLGREWRDERAQAPSPARGACASEARGRTVNSLPEPDRLKFGRWDRAHGIFGDV